jgi:deoxyribonuclease-4
MSIAGGIAKAFERGASVGCETIQIFSRSERRWQVKPYSEADIAAFKAQQARTQIAPVVAHASYLLNLASPLDTLRAQSREALADELERCALLGIPYLVFHPGSHMGSGVETGLQRIAQALNQLFETGVGQGVTVLMETTAGQGSSLGWRFEELAQIFTLVSAQDRLGICVDTCHIFAAGYDLRTPAGYEATFNSFEHLLGLEKIKVVHLNDSVKELGSRLDRHTHIGEGQIGLEAFRFIVNDQRFAHLPMILETPKGQDLQDLAGDLTNLAILRSLKAA